MFNREFVLEMLEHTGCLVTTAENGKIAVQKIRNGSFDLGADGYSDAEMDGYDATRAMRKMNDSNEIPYIPIVALTANAMKGDRERCLEAGMDDYLAKPVKKRQLIDTLLQWMPESLRYHAQDKSTHKKTRILLVEDDRTHQNVCHGNTATARA